MVNKEKMMMEIGFHYKNKSKNLTYQKFFLFLFYLKKDSV